MRVLHGHELHSEAVPSRHCFHFLRVVVGHQEIAAQCLANLKETLVVEFKIAIEAMTSSLATCGVRRVNEVDGVFTFCIFRQHFQTVSSPEIQPGNNEGQVSYSSRQRLRIPPRPDSFAVFAVVYEPRPFREDAAVERAISQNRLKRDFPRGFSRSLNLREDGFPCHVEVQNSLRKPFAVAVHNRLPHCRHLFVKLHHQNAVNEIFKQCSEADNPAARKWLNQICRLGRQAFYPAPKIWDKPSLSARIAKQTSLWH